MAKTTAVYARIDTDVKNKAEDILSRLGISPSSAMQMFYHQIIIHNGLPFETRLPAEEPVSVRALTRDELCAEIEKGLESVEEGKTLTQEEFDADLAARMKDV